MNFKIIIDNNLNPSNCFITEHGLSIYFEFEHKKFIIDTGQSGCFIANAEKLGIKLSDIDIVFISHGHFDHLGGLESFFKVNSKALVAISGKVLYQTYFSYRHISKREIGIDLSFIQTNRERFVFITNDTEILPGLFVITNINKDYPIPKANATLFKVENSIEIADDFKHEIIVCALKNKDLHVFTGCAHQGILNILSSLNRIFDNKLIKSVIGGFHLVDSDDKKQFETDEDISFIANDIIKYYPDAVFYTGHCTSIKAFEMLKSRLNSQINLFYSGFELEN
jgi:7,8-dihydropterin-6-yl-methyl-4-(beta-D-ribofuranosyl)aminobenzene 5'-phosphate synthase